MFLNHDFNILRQRLMIVLLFRYTLESHSQHVYTQYINKIQQKCGIII